MTVLSAQNAKSRYATQAFKRIFICTLLLAWIAEAACASIDAISVTLVRIWRLRKPSGRLVWPLFVCSFAASPLSPIAMIGLAQNPVPFLNQPLVPTSAAPGGPGFTLTVNGTGFVSGATVQWNGNPLPTVFENSFQLEANVSAANIALPNTASITVINPEVLSSSNIVFFTVTPTTSSVVFASAPGSPIATAGGPIAVGDFNGDAKADLAVFEGNAVNILLSNGDGTFHTSSAITLSAPPLGITTGDFNNDGILDIAVSIYEGNPSNSDGIALTVLLGNGDGTFRVGPTTQLPSDLPVDYGYLTTADFNRDGKLDVAVSIGDVVVMCLGNGDGTFTPMSSMIHTGLYYPSIAAGDFTGDGYLDLVVSDFDNYDEVIYLGNGDGTFSAGTATEASWAHPTAVAVADVNGDGRLDLAASGYAIAAGGTTVYLGAGDGTFTPTNSSNPAGYFPFSTTFADFNGDGKLDLAFANQTDGVEQATILLGDGQGNFETRIPLVTGGEAYSLVVGDFNGDGRADLAISTSNGIAVLLQVLGASLSTTSIVFPDQLINTSSSGQTVTFTNYAASAQTISSIVIGGTNGGDFAVATSGTTCSPATPVAANGGTCNIVLTFSPSAVGPRAGTLTITDSDPNSPQILALAGTGTVAPIASFNSKTLTFPSQTLNTTSAAQSVTITNTGTASLIISTITEGGTNASEFSKIADFCSGATVAPSGTCTVSMTFTPAGLGSRLASLLFADNASDSPQMVTLSGTGAAAPAPLVSLSFSSLIFSGQTIDTTIAGPPVTVTNSGSADLIISAVTLGGTNASDFAKSVDTCTGATIAPNGTCMAGVTFTPSATGSRSASMSFIDNASGSPQIVSISGTGIAPTGTPVLTLSTTSLNFGAVITQGSSLPAGTPNTSQTMPVTLTNNGTASLTFPSNAFTFSGANLGDFAVDLSQSNACSSNTPIAPNSSCLLYFVFTPTATAERSAALTVSSNASASQTVTLTGIGMPYFNQCGGTASDSVPVPQKYDGGQSTCSYGCALSSGAMVLATFSDFSTETPYSLNAFAKSNGLFSYDSEDGLSDLLSLAELPHYVPDPDLQTASLSDYSYVSQYLQQHVTGQQQQVILHLHMTGALISGTGQCAAGDHYVAVVGPLGSNDWQLADPGWSATNPSNALFSLYDHLVGGFEGSNGTITCQHTFTVANILLYGTPTSAESLEVEALSPVELLVTDAQGRQLGNVSSGVDVFAIPNSSYFRDFPVADDTGSGPAIGDPNGLKTAFISGPANGPFTVKVAGTNSGPYTLLFRGVASDGSVQVATESGIAAVGSSSQYQVTYSPTPGTPLAITQLPATPTLLVTPFSTSITTAQALTVTIGVSGGTGNPTPTGSVMLTSGTYTSAAATLSSGGSTINIPAGKLATGSDILTASYTPDSSSSSTYNTATGTASVTVTQAKTTPTVTISPSANSITTAQPLTVTVTLTGTPTPTGSVTLTSGSYTSPATALTTGVATINVPAGSLATGSDTLTASYMPDSGSSSIYNSATGTASVTVTQAKTTPTVTVSLSSLSITTAQSLTVTVTVAGTPTPTGSVTVTSGSYTSPAMALTGGVAAINVAEGSLAVGSDTLTASYTPDSGSSSIYNSATGTASVTVTTAVSPSFTVSGTAVTISPGASTGNTSTITVTPSGGFTGSVALTAVVASSPNGAQYPPTLSFGSTSPVSITGTNVGTATLTISTTAPTSAALIYPKRPGVPWYVAGGATLTLACLLLFGIPARRRSWRTMLGLLVLPIIFAGGVLSCGGGGSGGGGGGGTGNPGTTAGMYTVTVTGTASNLTETTTVTVTVN